jgi:excisionase family DNA binding protein
MATRLVKTHPALRVGQAAEMLHVSVETLRRWVAEGRLRVERSSGGQRLVPIAEVTRLLAEKRTLFDLLDAEAGAGIKLTESNAMLPGASVSGYYLWHPEAHYFGVGRIGRDQLADYASRKGVELAEAERWLRPNLADYT